MALTDYDDAADNIPAGGIDNGPGALADGEYEFIIDKVVEKETKSGNLFAMKLMVLTDGIFAGRQVNVDYWLTRLNKDIGKMEVNGINVGNLRQDLGKMGFDEENWTKANGRPFFTEFKKAMLLMEGLRFKAKKATNTKNAKFPHFNVTERIVGDCQSEKIGKEEIDAAEAANAIPI